MSEKDKTVDNGYRPTHSKLGDLEIPNITPEQAKEFMKIMEEARPKGLPKVGTVIYTGTKVKDD